MLRIDTNMRLALTLLASLSSLADAAAQWTWDGVRPAATEPSAAFSPDGRTLAVVQSKGTIRAGNGVVRVWDLATGKETKKITLALAPGEIPERVSYNSRGELVVLLCQYKGFKSGPGWAKQGTISACLWNAASDKRSPFIEIGYGGVAVCPKGELLAFDRGIWDVATGKKLRNVVLPDGLVGEIDFSPDGKKVLYRVSESLARDFALLFLADVATGKKVLQIGEIDLEKHRGRCSLLFGPKFSLDGNRLAFGEAYRPTLHLWDVPEAKAVQRIPLKELEEVVGFSPNGRTLFTWRHADGELRRWETATGKARQVANVGKSINAALTGIDEVLLSPDGKTVVLRKGGAIEFRSLKD